VRGSTPLAALILAGGALQLASVAAQPPLVPATFELAVSGGEPTLEQMGIRPEERAVALPLIARALHGAAAVNTSGSLAVTFTEIFGPVTTGTSAPVPPGPAAVVLAPFSDSFWRQVLQIDRDADLFAAIVKHRGAMLLAAGALYSGAGTRTWLEREPALAAQIVKSWPGAFAVAAPGLSITENGVQLAGGQDAVAAWTALVGVPPTEPSQFLRRLLDRDDGRLARFFATIRQLDEGTREAVLAPLAGETATAALDAVYKAARRAEPVWPPNVHPYQLTNADLPSVLRGLSELNPSELPQQAGLWPALLRSDVGSRRDAAAILAQAPASSAYTATVRAILDGQYRERRDRLTMVVLARRVWHETADSTDQADAVYALAQFPRYRALLLTLDRIGIVSPGAWAASVDAARRVDEGGGSERTERMAVFQGALAMLERSCLAGSLGAADADRLVRTLADGVVKGSDLRRVVASWITDDLLPALPPLVRPDAFTGRTAYESRILQALGGPTTKTGVAVSWEGLDYTVDVAAAERERILRIRELLPSPGLDAALESDSRARLAAALTALAYAPALGDPDGPVTLSPDVISRHAFGPATPNAGRQPAWSPPLERSGTGAPWHVEGSLLGLDLALARIALRRISVDDMPAIPTINLNDQFTLARTAVAMTPSALSDETRDRIAAAIARGRKRVAQAGANPAAVDELAGEIGMSGAQRQTLPWTLSRDPDAAPRLFGLRDLFWLGRDGLDAKTLAPWGVMADTVYGRLVPRFEAPVAWDLLAGRPDTGMLATQVPDLTLRLAEETARLHLPATLIPAALLYLTQDYWHEVDARFADDWPAMVRGAAAIDSSRMGDYVAALGSQGPLRSR
jgi:hypothetical protein